MLRKRPGGASPSGYDDSMMNAHARIARVAWMALIAFFADATAARGVILTYHTLERPAGVTHALSSESFAADLDALRSLGIRFVTISELSAALANGDSVIAVTFDDGDASVIDVAWPLLAERGIQATVFVLSERIDRPGSLSTADLRTLAAAGWEIASHGAAHVYYPDVSAATIAADLAAGIAAIEAATGATPRCFAFPFGGYDARVTAIVARFHPCAVTSAPGLAEADAALLARPATSPLDRLGIAWRIDDGRDPLTLALAVLATGLLLPSERHDGSPPPLWTPTEWRALGGGRLSLGGGAAGIEEALSVRDGAWALHAWRGFGPMGGGAIGVALDLGGARASGGDDPSDFAGVRGSGGDLCRYGIFGRGRPAHRHGLV